MQCMLVRLFVSSLLYKVKVVYYACGSHLMAKFNSLCIVNLPGVLSTTESFGEKTTTNLRKFKKIKVFPAQTQWHDWFEFNGWTLNSNKKMWPHRNMTISVNQNGVINEREPIFCMNHQHILNSMIWALLPDRSFLAVPSGYRTISRKKGKESCLR